MALLANPLNHLPICLPNTSLTRRKHPLKPPRIRLRLEDHDSVEFEQASSSQSEPLTSDVWKLFTEAQRNILHLNKQRLMAVEELNKAKREIQTLVKRIENMESPKHGDAGKRDVELLAELRQLLEQTRRSGFHIVHICAEMDPVVSVGSLASYVTGLSRALQRKGNLVEVILPKYKILDLTEVQGLREIQGEFYSYFNGQLQGNKIWTGVVYGIGVTFIQPVHLSTLFNRDAVYGYSDDFERFMYFSRASLDYLVKSGKHPDILHIHNWETAIVAPLFWDIFVNQGLAATRIMLTCQGFGSQCLEQPEKLALCGLDPSRLKRPDRLQDNMESHLVNPLKGGVIYSNKVLVMSSTYSKGRIIQSFGHQLEPTLSSHKDKLVVAPHGFECSAWDPSKDQFLPEKYSASKMKGKAVCKGSLQRHLGFSEDASSILVGCIFSEISDVDLENLMGVLRLASLSEIQFLFMGVSKIPSINSVLKSLQEELKDEDVIFLNNYDESLSHLIFGGSDIILCHSYEDPVLQVPLKAITYGAAPILMTAVDKRFRNFVEHDFGSTQFSQSISTFSNMSLMEAVDEIRNMPSEWNQKIKAAMSRDFSWDAECYDVHISAYDSIKNL